MSRSSPLAVLVAVVMLSCLVAGCTTYRPQYFWEVSKTKTVLEANNYKLAKLGVQADDGCAYLFGFSTRIGAVGIPLDSTAILKNAMMEFHQRAGMVGKPAFLHNINVEWTVRGVPFLMMVKRVTITADVYEFTGEYVDYRTR